jgi:two-component system sensor histidine kinase KdpD
VAAGDALGSDTISGEEREELAAVVQVEGQRLSRLVGQLLDLSRLESGAAEPRRDWTSIEEIVRAAAEEVPGVDLDLIFDPDLPLVEADAAQLERAVVNVIENAARHGAGSAVSVHARMIGSRLVLRIVDRGPGIPRADLERIFEPFDRGGEGSQGRSGSGTGLGLAIARGFVGANGGTIRAESLPGQGAAIVIELPIEPAPAPEPGVAR